MKICCDSFDIIGWGVFPKVPPVVNDNSPLAAIAGVTP